MRIGINFDDTLTDTNYSMIDVINNRRKKENHISYNDFDNSKCSSIWDYNGLSPRERQLRHLYKDELLKYVDICPLSKNVINNLISKGNEIFIFSSRDKSQENAIKRFIDNKGFNIKHENIFLGLTVSEKIEKVKDLEIDFYVDDLPEVLSSGIKNDINIVVRDQVYNKNFQNLIRMECFSQLSGIKNRIKDKIEKKVDVK